MYLLMDQYFNQNIEKVQYMGLLTVLWQSCTYNAEIIILGFIHIVIYLKTFLCGYKVGRNPD